MSSRVTCLGKWLQASDPAGPTFKNKIKERERDLFFGIFILKSEFFLCCKKNTNLVFRIPDFRRNVTNMHIYEKKCIYAYDQYPNMFWTFFFKKKIEVSKMCFRMDFLNTTKNYFLAFWILQHVCKTPKGIG